MAQYDALLLSSFGGPEGQDDVIPFLRNVTAGRGIPDERLEEVAQHYRSFDGVSPINAQNRALKAALESELAAREIDMPVYWGNRNAAPFFADAVREAHTAGDTKLLGLVTSAYSSYSGVAQYREDFEKAIATHGLEAEVSIDRVREYFDHPGFVTPFIEGVRDALSSFRAQGIADGRVHVLFVTHSIPHSDAHESGPEFGSGGAYVAQHLAVAAHIHENAAPDAPWSLVYQSRSGEPSTPWLEPDINDAIDEMAVAGLVQALIIVPFGFVSDHMEVLWDLDNEAIATATGHGIRAVRVPTPGVHPAFVSGLVDLVMERLHDVPHEQRPHLTDLGPWADHERVGAPDDAFTSTGDAA